MGMSTIKNNLNLKNKKELVEIAKELNILDSEKQNKPELIDLIRKKKSEIKMEELQKQREIERQKRQEKNPKFKELEELRTRFIKMDGHLFPETNELVNMCEKVLDLSKQIISKENLKKDYIVNTMLALVKGTMDSVEN
jgi:hypothetical protein